MRSVHVLPRITSEASGPAYSVVGLCEALRKAGGQPTLAVVAPGPDRGVPDFVRVFPSERGPYKLGRSAELNRYLREAVRRGEVDVVHNHSLWMMPNIYPGWATRGRSVPLVVAPRGTLSSWALNRSRWIKKIIWVALQEPAIRNAACFHATAESEYQDIRRSGFRQPVCIIPNGIDIPQFGRSSVAGEGPRRLLFLSRIHPKKGLECLLRAWAAVEDRFPEWMLEIVGPDDGGHLSKMQALAAALKLSRVTFRGPLYGAEKEQAYRDAELYVLPTHSENFGMTVAEALAVGTPTIVSQAAPWAGLETHRAGWWIELGFDSLVACLEEALACSREVLAAKGASGRRWMEEEYSWAEIGAKMLKTYEWLRNGGPLPEWVRD